MSLHHFFLENQVLASEPDEVFALRLAPDDAKHARVLRLAPGEHIAVVDAASDYFECEVVSCDGGLAVRICGHEAGAEPGPSVVLVQGLCKGDKMDEVIRHATELGVDAFVPLACARSVVRLDGSKAAARVERWRAVAKSAAMQAGRRSIPEVAPVSTVAEACALLANATCVAVCWEEARHGSMGEVIHGALASTHTPARDARVAVVVGPEGGLTAEEAFSLAACNKQGATVTLGANILRTETAGVVAPALALYELGGLR